MTTREQLLSEAISATGDESIYEAGLFVPRGLMGRTGVGAIFGGLIGSLAGPAGTAAGTAMGAGVGIASVADEGLSLIVALTPDKVYVLHKQFGNPADHTQTLLHTYDRDDLEVTIKARSLVRVMTLADHNGEDGVQLEAARPRPAARAVMHELALAGDEDE